MRVEGSILRCGPGTCLQYITDFLQFSKWNLYDNVIKEDLLPKRSIDRPKNERTYTFIIIDENDNNNFSGNSKEDIKFFKEAKKANCKKNEIEKSLVIS